MVESVKINTIYGPMSSEILFSGFSTSSDTIFIFIEALPRVWGIGEQEHLFQGNRGTKAKF